MVSEDELLQRWKEFYWAENVYEHWEAFFASLAGQPAKAEALCQLGMRLVRSEIVNDRTTRAMFDHIVVSTRQPGLKSDDT